MNAISISKLAGRTGLTAATIRYYERAGLLSEPRRTPAGHRRYGDAHVKELCAVIEARRAGFSVAEIRRMRSEARGRVLPPERVLRFVTRKLARVDTELKSLRRQREFLVSMRDRCGEHGCHWWLTGAADSRAGNAPATDGCPDLDGLMTPAGPIHKP